MTAVRPCSPLLLLGACLLTGLILEQTELATSIGFHIISPMLDQLSKSPLVLLGCGMLTLTLVAAGCWHVGWLEFVCLCKDAVGNKSPGEPDAEEKESMQPAKTSTTTLEDVTRLLIKGEDTEVDKGQRMCQIPKRQLDPVPSAFPCGSVDEFPLPADIRMPSRQIEQAVRVPPQCAENSFPPGLEHPMGDVFSRIMPSIDTPAPIVTAYLGGPGCPQKLLFGDWDVAPPSLQSLHSPLSSHQQLGDKVPEEKLSDSLSSDGDGNAGFSKLMGSTESLQMVSYTSIAEKLKADELYIFFTPINELVRFFSAPGNHPQLGLFYERLLSHASELPPSVAADLLRLPVRLQELDSRVIRALCDRLLAFAPDSRNLTSMQLALVAWSLAKAQVACNGERFRGLAFDCTAMMDSIAKETILKIREFQPLSIANLMWACGKMRYKNPHLLIQLTAAGAAQLSHFNAQNIANTYWSLGALEFDKTSLTPRHGTEAENEISAILTAKLSAFNPQALANFVWACAKLRWDNPRLVMSAAHEAFRCISDFKPQEIANLLWGLAKLGLSEARPIMHLLAQEAAQNLHTFNSQEVANAYWAIGTLEIRTTALTPADLNVNISNSLSTSSAQALSSNFSTDTLPEGHMGLGVSGYQTSTTRDPSTMETLGKYDGANSCDKLGVGYDDSRRCQSRLLSTILDKMTQFNAQAVANFFWACGKLQWKCPEICEASFPVVKKNIRYFRPQNTANFLWAMAKLKFRKEELIDILTDQALRNLPEFNTQEIANLYWALGTLEVRNTPLTPAGNCAAQASEWEATRKAYGARRKFTSGEAGGSAVCELLLYKLRDFKPQEVANFLWACARLKWKNPAIVEEAVVVAFRLLGRFKPQEIGNLVWSLAKLNYRHVGLLKAMCEYVAPNIHDFASQNVANIYWALGSLGFTQTALSPEDPSPQFIESLTKFIEQFNNQEVMNFLWACSKLRWSHPKVIDAAAAVAYGRIGGLRSADVFSLHSALRKLGRSDLIES